MTGDSVWLGIISLSVSFGAIVFSIVAYYKNRQSKTYADLDTLYLAVLQIGMKYPDFRNSAKTCKYKIAFCDKERVRYDTYAYIAWNVCETVYDRAYGDDKNWETWEPIIKTENTLHRTWLFDGKHRDQFKDDFITFIENEIGKTNSGAKRYGAV